MLTIIQNLLSALLALLLAPALGNAQAWKLIGISGQQADTTAGGTSGFAYPDHMLFDLDELLTDEFGEVAQIFQVPFVNDSQSIGFCPANGLVYHTGGSESYSNNPLRKGHDQGGPDILGVGYQDSQFMESIDLQTRTFTGIFNAAPCPNPDPTLPCFGVVAPRPSWVLPVEQRNSTQTGSEYGARGSNEFHAIRGLAWSASKNLFYAADDEGIFKITLDGDSQFVARPAFPADNKADESKAILVIPERVLVGHRNGFGDFGYLMEVDVETGAVVRDIALKYPPGGGEPVGKFGGLLGLAQHPVTRVIYGVRKTDDNFARELVTINPVTGDTARVGPGNLKMHIASIAFVSTQNPLSPWKLIGISGQQADTTAGGTSGFAYPDHMLFDLDELLTDEFGEVAQIFQVPFVNDSQSIGFCPANGLVYHTGGSESYSNNPLRKGHDQGGPDILGVGYQDSQFMESIDLQTRTFTGIFNAAPCPNPDPTLPCFGVVAPRPSWVLPVEQRNSTQTGSEYGARGSNEFHAIRGLAWSASKNLFYAADDEGIFKITLDGDSQFVARPAFPADNKADESKAILVIPERVLVGHRNGFGDFGYLMEVDVETGAVVRDIALKYPPGGGEPVGKFGGLLGLAQHPVTRVIYGVRKTDDNFARELVTINPVTGDTARVGPGNLKMHIASIAFVGEPPLKIRSITRNANNITLTWAGGHPPYQLQASSDLNSGSWSDVGTPTAAFSATVAIEGTARYFRVTGQ